MTLDEEVTEICDWAWTEGLDAINAKDNKYCKASVYVEMFLVLGAVLEQQGWTRDELISMLDECAFENTVPGDGVVH